MAKSDGHSSKHLLLDLQLHQHGYQFLFLDTHACLSSLDTPSSLALISVLCLETPSLDLFSDYALSLGDLMLPRLKTPSKC